MGTPAFTRCRLFGGSGLMWFRASGSWSLRFGGVGFGVKSPISSVFRVAVLGIKAFGFRILAYDV